MSDSVVVLDIEELKTWGHNQQLAIESSEPRLMAAINKFCRVGTIPYLSLIAVIDRDKQEARVLRVQKETIDLPEIVTMMALAALIINDLTNGALMKTYQEEQDYPAGMLPVQVEMVKTFKRKIKDGDYLNGDPS